MHSTRRSHRQEATDGRTARAGRLAVLLLATACSGCVQARIDGNEASAIGSVRAVLSAQATHAAMCEGSYAATLPALAAKGFLGGDLGAAEQPLVSGYRFRMTAVKGEGTTTCGDAYADFEIRAEPEAPGESGARYFRATNAFAVYAASRPDFSDAKKLE